MTPEARILARLVGEVRDATGLDVRQDAPVMARLRDAAGRAAREVADFGKTTITLPALAEGPEGTYHLAITVFGDREERA